MVIFFCLLFLVPPGPPTSLITTRIGKDFATLEWRHPKDDGGSKILKYIIKKRKDKKSDWERVMSVDGQTTTYKVTDLKEGTECYLAVCAENKVGLGKNAEIPEAIVPVREASTFNFISRAFMNIVYEFNF